MMSSMQSIYCRKCGYRLAGLAENRCPECGQTFNPLEPSTFLRHPHGPEVRQVKWIARAVAIVLVGVFVVLLAGAAWLFFYSDWPGGMRPSYKAADYDARLTREAKSAVVIIEALQRYRRDKQAFPADATLLAPYLPPGSTTPQSPDICGWYFTLHTNSSGYTLARRLGWDPSLCYEFNGSEGQWILDPGDGSPAKPIVLTP